MQRLEGKIFVEKIGLLNKERNNHLYSRVKDEHNYAFSYLVYLKSKAIICVPVLLELSNKSAFSQILEIHIIYFHF